MDDIVRQAMAKWPNVPAVYGWLALDRRGTWLLKGDRIGNPGIVEFIQRNYDHDDAGQWFFQNGPQRVFVRLECTPWILRTGAEGRLVTHTGRQVEAVDGVWLDETGTLIVLTEYGAGLVDDRDAEEFSARFTTPDGAVPDEDGLLAAIERIVGGEAGPLLLNYAGTAVPVGSMPSELAPGRLGFVRDPQPLPSAAAG